MFDFFKRFFRRFEKNKVERLNSGDAAKERLHSVLMQDRANVSADFIDLMKQDIIDDIKKYVDVDENEVDVRLASQIKNDGTNGAPIVYANIPITTVKSFSNNVKKTSKTTEVGSVIQSSNNNNIDNKNENSVVQDLKSESVQTNVVADSKQKEKISKESAIDKKKVVKKVEPSKEEKKEETAEKKSETKKKVNADVKVDKKVDNKSKEDKIAKENENKELEEKAEVKKTAKTKKTTSVTKTSKVAKDEKVEEKKVKSTTRKTAVKK